MRISDWGSDVCSSDLTDIPRLLGRFASVGNFFHSGKLFFRYLMDRLSYSRGTRLTMGNALVARLYYSLKKLGVPVLFETKLDKLVYDEIGRASCRERVCQYV